tara:strand:+ start:2652 stop:3968 length:1317 start_codon:yes stop_codon:yes gene_type:complete
MGKYKFLQPTFTFFLINSFFINLVVYISQFILLKDKVNYFLCTEIIEYQVLIFSRDFTFIYPESCDLAIYTDGIVNFLNLFTLENYVYINRPLFVMYIFIFYKFLSTILISFTLSDLVLVKASFYLGQLFLTSFASISVYKLFSNLNFQVKNKYYYFPLIISLSPIFKWHIFESASMTFTFLIFVIGLNLLLNFENINSYKPFLFSGFLFLIHRSAIVIPVLLLFYILISKKFKLKNIYRILSFFIPSIAYYSLINIFSNYTDHQAEGYKQFTWILDYFQGREVNSGGYFCQTPKLALSCYLNDVISLLQYLTIPSLFVLAFILFRKKFNFKEIELIKYSVIFALLINLFWLFIGWYPPIRFSYYGYGNLVIFMMIFILLLIDDKFSLILFLLGYISYFLNLNHWNLPEVIAYTGLIKTSILFFFSAIFVETSSRNET